MTPNPLFATSEVSSATRVRMGDCIDDMDARSRLICVSAVPLGVLEDSISFAFSKKGTRPYSRITSHAASVTISAASTHDLEP